MSSIALIFLAVAVVVAVIFWKNREVFLEGSLEQEPEDIRVSPLLKGINYLLSDKPDQALQEMVQLAKISSESTEVYMALGEMFRNQGEYGRAVRIHQNLLARPDVSVEFHFQAYVSLGRDFQAGGLLDRSLRHYAKALAIHPDHLESLSACLRIREQSHEWEEAEWLVSRLEQIEDKSYHEHRAYLKAEMASSALVAKDKDACKRFIQESLQLSPTCTHAHLLLMKRFIEEEQYDEALLHAGLFIDQVKTEHHALLPKTLMITTNFYHQYVETFLFETWKKHHDIEFAVTWIEELAKLEGIKSAEILKDKLELRDLSLRHELCLLSLENGQGNLVKQAKSWRSSMKHYVCKYCGVQVHAMRWHCPKCNKWGTMEPLQTSPFGEEENAQ